MHRLRFYQGLDRQASNIDAAKAPEEKSGFPSSNQLSVSWRELWGAFPNNRQ
jgi:hypothetical protein